LQHPDNLVKTRLVHKTAGPGIGKTEIAVQVAPVGEIDVCKKRLGVMVIAQTARSRATSGWSYILGIRDTFSHGIIFIKLVVQHRVRPVNVPEIPMLGARPFQPDLALFLDDVRINDGITGRAKTASLFYQH
jgi:hypothetical protein